MITAILLILLGAALGAALFPLLKSLPSLRSFPSFTPRNRRKIVIWSHEPLSEQELRAAFSSVTMDDRLFRSLLQVIQENLDNAVSEVGAVGIADKPGVLAHTAGGVEWMQFLQSDIADLMTGDQRRQFKPSGKQPTETAN